MRSSRRRASCGAPHARAPRLGFALESRGVEAIIADLVGQILERMTPEHAPRLRAETDEPTRFVAVQLLDPPRIERIEVDLLREYRRTVGDHPQERLVLIMRCARRAVQLYERIRMVGFLAEEPPYWFTHPRPAARAHRADAKLRAYIPDRPLLNHGCLLRLCRVASMHALCGAGASACKGAPQRIA